MINGNYLSKEVKPVRAGDQVYNILRKAIMQEELKAGEPIDISHLTSILKISRTPLNEAIHRLEGEGWVTRQINGRVVVAGISVKELMDFYAVRSALEGLAIREAILNITDKDLEEIEEQLSVFSMATNDDCDGENIVSAGEKLHSMIYELAKNDVCKRMLEDINANLERYRVYTASMPGRYEEALEEHLEICKLLKERRADEAEAVMRRHILRAGEKLKLVNQVQEKQTQDQ